MYKLHYTFSPINKYCTYYLIDDTMLNNFNIGRFNCVIDEVPHGFRMYKQHTGNVYTLINTTNMKVANYNDLLDIYSIINLHRSPIGMYKELQLDLELILINWDTS